MHRPLSYPPQARMPSMRPAPSAPPAARKPAAAEPRRDDRPLSEEEERELAGGFHESSYELRTGLDMLETDDWPDDATLPFEPDDA